MNWILKRLGRVTLTTSYLPEIDGLRFLAITAVIMCHLSSDLVLRHEVQLQAHTHWIYATMVHGERGVQLFFSISGFILALAFAKRYLAGNDGPDLGRYFRRRLFRLEPPYLLNVAILTIATWAVNPAIRPIVIWHAVAGVTYTHGLLFHYVNPINMIWWSLEIEAQFYMLMPLLAQVFRIRDARLRRGILVAVALTAFSWQGTHSWIVTQTILANIQYFLVGLLAADLYQSRDLRKERNRVWDVMGGLSVVLLFVLPRWGWPILTFCILAGALNGKYFRGFLSLPWISAIGSMCYTVYLWHVLVMALVLKTTIKFAVPNSFLLSMATQTAIIVPAIFFFSVALFLLVEKPCMDPEWPTAFRESMRSFFKTPSAPISIEAAE